MKSKEKALKIADLAHRKKARNIVALEMKTLSAITDYFVICSGTSAVHLSAVADGIIEGLLKQKLRPFGVEGTKFQSWILIDYGDVIVHLFRDEARDFYRLENLWGDAKRIETKRKDEPQKHKRPETLKKEKKEKKEKQTTEYTEKRKKTKVKKEKMNHE